MRESPRVLLTNDDAGPNHTNSPFILPLALALRSQLGWDVRVVCPAKQQSWKGKSYLITEQATGYYMTPTAEGLEGERRELPNLSKEEWIMIDSTPATCVNIGLHSLYEPDFFDLVIAGPNYGRNTSSAFALSSGTIGASLSAALSGVPSISLSFGLMTGHKPPAENLVEAGIKQSCEIISKLWQSGFDSEVDVYSINVPLQPELLQPGGTKVEWTEMARTSYQRLFKSIGKSLEPEVLQEVDPAGPAAIEDYIGDGEQKESRGGLKDEHKTAPLKFAFAPDISSLIDPNAASLRAGSDTHALHSGHISVTPIIAAFQSAPPPAFKWRL